MGRRALALGAALALVAAAPAAAAQSDPKGDATGPLDVTSADLTAQGANLEFTVETAGTWNPADLVAGGGRSLCLKLTGAGVDQVCVQAVGRRAVLIAPGSTTPITAAVHRPNDRSLQARFDPAQVGLKAGTDFKWQVITAYDGATDQGSECRRLGHRAPAEGRGLHARRHVVPDERAAQQEGRRADL